MKKLGWLISLITIMLLSGCLSEKTAGKLNEVPGEVVDGVTQGDYVFKNTSLSSSLTNVNSSFMQFSYSSVESLGMDPTDINKIVVKTSDVNKIVPYIKVNSYEGTDVDKSNEMKNNLNIIIPSGIVSKKKEGNIKVSSRIFEYNSGEIKKDDKVYYYINASFSEIINVEGVNKTYTYLITSVTEGNLAKDFVYFEDIVRSFKAGVPTSAINLTYQSELIKTLKDLNDENKNYNYLSSTVQQSIYENINNFLVYVESAYGEEIADDINKTKREEAYDYIETKKFKYIKESTTTEVNVWETIAELFNNVYYAQISHLEGQVAIAQGIYIKAISDPDIRPVTVTNLSALEESLNDLITLKIKEDTQKGYNYDDSVIKEVVISELKNISSNQSSNLFLQAINYIVIGYLEDIRLNGLGEGVYPNQPYQSLLTYEQKLSKIIMYKSYAYYKQEYFLEPTGTTFTDGYNGNIRDYLLIKAVESLEANTQDIGDSKVGPEDEDWETRKINYVFNTAKENVLNEKIDNLNIALNSYFNKIETAKVRNTLSTLNLGEIRNTIKLALGDLINSVRIYDAYTGNIVLDSDGHVVGIPSGILNENLATNKMSNYILTSEVLINAIKSTYNSMSGVDYKGDTVNILNGKTYIDIWNIANNTPYLVNGIRKDFRVEVAFEILDNKEQYVVIP